MFVWLHFVSSLQMLTKHFPILRHLHPHTLKSNQNNNTLEWRPSEAWFRRAMSKTQSTLWDGLPSIDLSGILGFKTRFVHISICIILNFWHKFFKVWFQHYTHSLFELGFTKHQNMNSKKNAAIGFKLKSNSLCLYCTTTLNLVSKIIDFIVLMFCLGRHF